jgi:ABC-type multidrug transport system fused ATPase/permease subunit
MSKEGYTQLEQAPPKEERRMASTKSKHEYVQDLSAIGKDDLVWILDKVSKEREDVLITVVDTSMVGTSQAEEARRKSAHPADEDHDPNELPVIQFGGVEFHCHPADGEVIVVINRTGSKKGASKIKCVTDNLTAIAGKHYDKVEETVVFEPGQGQVKLKVPLIDAETWEALLDFNVKFVGESVEGAKLGHQLFSTKVKIIGVGTFPASHLRPILEADTELDTHENKVTFFKSFLNLIWSDSKIRCGIIKRVLEGQLHNLNFVVMQFISVFTINEIFKGGGGEDDIGPFNRHEWLIAIVGVQILSIFTLHSMDFMKLGWSVGGPSRKMIQKGILRRYMYLSSSARDEVRSTDLGTAVTRNALACVGGVGLCIALCNVIGGIVGILVFKLTAPIVFQAKSRINLLSFSPFIVYPVVLGTCISLRAPKTTDALDTVQDTKDNLLEYSMSAVEHFPVLSDFRRRNKYVDDTEAYINAYNKANKEKNQLVTNNSYLPHWLSAFFVAAWYLYFGEEVLDGTLSLGFFLADLKIIDKFAKEFEQLYMILMAMESTFPDLQRLVILLNRETDLDDRVVNEKVVLERTETLREELSKQGTGALDRIPIYAENLQFKMENIKFKFSKSFNFAGKVQVEQGQLCALFGKHGHGKSMLLKVIGGRIFPNIDAGEVFIPAHLRVLHVPFESIFLAKSFKDNMLLGTETATDAKKDRVMKILEKFKLKDSFEHLWTDDDDKSKGSQGLGWMAGRTVKELSMLNLARAMIANPHILTIHKPTLAKAPKEAAAVMGILKEFVDLRGIEQEPDQPVSSRRPRTIIFTSISYESLKHANVIYKVTNHDVTQYNDVEEVNVNDFG